MKLLMHLLTLAGNLYVIHDGNLAVPIVDRVIPYSHIFMLGGGSYRLKRRTGG